MWANDVATLKFNLKRNIYDTLILVIIAEMNPSRKSPLNKSNIHLYKLYTIIVYVAKVMIMISLKYCTWNNESINQL